MKQVWSKAADRARTAKVATIRAKFDLLIQPIRDAARAVGYAVAVHGSGARDIDLAAIPWTDQAVCAHELVGVVVEAIHKANGGCGWSEDRSIGHMLSGEKKPHGRRAWSIYIATGIYIDLSVMPRIVQP